MCRLLLPLLLCACAPQVGPPLDAGATDAGAGDSGVDAGSADAGAFCNDLRQNGDESDVDCGGSCTPCALGRRCVTAPDCEPGVCTAGACTAPQNACAAAFAGCTTFTDLTAPGANRSITFPNGNESYSPRCVTVRFGQAVTFSGDFGAHPLREACGPLTAGLSASSGQRLTVTFDKALGRFGFFCTQHGSSSGSGMAGAIEVVR